MKSSTRIVLSLICMFIASASALAQETTPSPIAKESESSAETSPKEIPKETQPPQADPELIPPKLLTDVKPIYPQAALAEGLSAEVVLDIDIDAAGKVEQARITKPSEAEGYGFNNAALEAAQNLVFEPARYDGQAVPVRISYRMRFVPDISPPPPVEEPPPPPSGQILGRLQERGTRLPLGGVKVTAFRGEGDKAEGFETETDSKGVFLFDGLGPGEWKILANPAGYYPLRATETVDADFRTDVRYSIEKRAYNPYDVVVEARRTRREVTQTSIDARRAERIPGTVGDVLAVIQNFPGVARVGGGELVVRGSAPDDSSIFINSMNVPNLYHFGGLRSVIPAGMIERINFYPGNFPVEYGNATGGAIDVDLRHLAPQKIGGYADVSLLDTSLYLEVPVTEEFALAFGGRRSYIGDLLGTLLDGVSDSFVAPRYYDFQVLASYRPSPAHRIETFFFLSDDAFEILFSDPVGESAEFVITDVNYGVNFNRTIAEYSFIPNDRFENRLKASYGVDKVHFNVGPDLFIDINLKLTQIRDTARIKLNDKLTLGTGAEFHYAQLDWQMRFPEKDEDANDSEDYLFTDIDTSEQALAGFLELSFQPFDSLLLVPGVRIDRYSRLDAWQVSPRFNGRQDLGDEWAVKAGVGLFVKEPPLEETDPDMGNPSLTIEKAMHYSLGLEYQPAKHIKMEITGFHKTMHDLVNPTDEVTEQNGETIPLRFNNGGAGRVSGLEVSARHELANRFFGWLAYTLSKSERKPYDKEEYELFEFDQTHILNVMGAYQLPKNWEISARFRLVSGNLYTPINGAVFSDDADDYLPIRGAANSARVDAFHQLDFRIDKKWIYENWMLNAYLDIQNVYNQQNPEGISYNFDYTSTSERSGLPIVPILGLKGEF